MAGPAQLMELAMEVDFLIVGGGPAGATAGGLLAQAGYRVAICEHKKFPRHKVCGEFISAQARPVLERLGLIDQFDAAAGPEIRRFAAHMPGGPVLSAAMPTCAGHYPQSLSRDVLDDMLLQRAAELGAQVLQPCHVMEVQGNAAEGFVAHTAQGPIQATCVILAHGLAQRGAMDGGENVKSGAQNVFEKLSRVPRPRSSWPCFANKTHDHEDPWSWHPASRIRSGGYMCFKCHLENCAIADDTIAIGGAKGLYAGLMRTSDDGSTRPRYTLAFVVRSTGILPVTPLHRQDACATSPADSYLRHLLQQNPAFRNALAHAKRIGPWYASGPMMPGVRNIYTDGRFFVGNAAGEVHALVGEGITLAMRGAACLVDSILAVDPDLHNLDAIGATYKTAWQHEFSARYHAANIFAKIAVRPGWAALAAGVLETFPALLDYCVMRSGKWNATENYKYFNQAVTKETA